MISNFSSTDYSIQFDARLSANPNDNRRLLLSAMLMVGFLLCGSFAQAQTAAPLVLPNTFSTVAGSTTGSAGKSGFTQGVPCAPGSPLIAADQWGNGCLATQAVFGTDFMDGVRVDGQGNIWIVDFNNNWSGASVQMLRRVDAKSGIVTLVANSSNAICKAATGTTAGSLDSHGSGCPFANAKVYQERGWGMDPYGNVFTGSYKASIVHIFCNAVSPLCPVAAGVTQTYSAAQKQVGYMYRIAGCVPLASGAATGTTNTGSPGSGDGYFASAFWNLPGDVAAWGPSNSAFSATPASATGGTCSSTTTGELAGGRAVVGDEYGNVFIGDGTSFRVRVIVGPPAYTLPSGVTLTNPLPAVIAQYSAYSSVTPAQMYGRIYPIFAGFPATTANSPCTSVATATATDTFGDNCPWYNTSQSQVAAPPVSLTIDSTTEGGTFSSNLVIFDGIGNALHVLYMGPQVAVGSATAAAYPMAHAIFKNNPTLSTITHGYVYLLAGNGNGAATGGSLSATPSLGTATLVGNASTVPYTRIAAAPNGNIFLAASSYPSSVTAGITMISGAAIAMYDLSTGYIRVVAQSAVPVQSSFNVVPGTSATVTSECPTPGTGDGQPAFATSSTFSAAALSTGICFNNYGTGSSQLTIATDSNNNLYIGDTEIDTAGYGRSRVRKVLASQLIPAVMGTPVTQTLYLHGPAGTTASATAITAAATEVSSSEMSVATPACSTTANVDGTVDCLATVTFTPAAPGLRTGSLLLSDPSLSVSSNSPLVGAATGSALVTDPTSPIAPLTTNLAGTHTLPVGAAVDANGDVFTMDAAAGKFTKISGGTLTQIAGTATLPSNPTQMSLDLSGNLYAAGTGASALTKLTLTGTSYVASTVTIAGVAAPQASVVDRSGNIFVADKTTASVYEVAAETVNGNSLPGTNGALPNSTQLVTVATGLSSPTSLAIDGYGNIYIGDSGAGSIFRVDASSGVMTTLLSGISPNAVAADAAGDVYYQDSTALNIVEIPYASISSGVAGSTSVTVLGSLKTPSGLAVAGNGNIYSADSGAGTLTFINRSSFTFNFGTGSSGSPTLYGTLTNVGNQAATSSNSTGNAANLVLSGSGSNACPFTTNVLGAQAAGSECTFTGSFVGLNPTILPVSSVVSYLPASTVGSLTLSGTLNDISGTTTNLATLGATSLPGVTIPLTATVASTVVQPGQTVTFLNGTTILGTATTNALGVATYNFTTGAIGTVYTFIASYAGNGTSLGASTSSPQTVSIQLYPTSVSLVLTTLVYPSTTPTLTTVSYPNGTVTLTATQTPAAVGETMNFFNGTTLLGSGTISSSGVATFVFTPTAGGVDSLTASFPADGKVYAASVSPVQKLTVSNSSILLGVTASVTSSPTAITVTPGTAGEVLVALTAQGGFSGVVTMGCTSPVAYVNCTLNYPSVIIGANYNDGTPSFNGTISVASTTSLVRSISNGLALALLAPFGLLGLALRLRKRTGRMHRFTLVVLLVACGVAAACGVTGCASSTTSAIGPTPSGSQVVTFTATAAGVTQTTSMTVNFQ